MFCWIPNDETGEVVKLKRDAITFSKIVCNTFLTAKFIFYRKKRSVGRGRGDLCNFPFAFTVASMRRDYFNIF